jgi:hypothetical protein
MKKNNKAKRWQSGAHTETKMKKHLFGIVAAMAVGGAIVHYGIERYAGIRPKAEARQEQACEYKAKYENLVDTTEKLKAEIAEERREKEAQRKEKEEYKRQLAEKDSKISEQVALELQKSKQEPQAKQPDIGEIIWEDEKSERRSPADAIAKVMAERDKERKDKEAVTYMLRDAEQKNRTLNTLLSHYKTYVNQDLAENAKQCKTEGCIEHLVKQETNPAQPTKAETSSAKEQKPFLMLETTDNKDHKAESNRQATVREEQDPQAIGTNQFYNRGWQGHEVNPDLCYLKGSDGKFYVCGQPLPRGVISVGYAQKGAEIRKSYPSPNQ